MAEIVGGALTSLTVKVKSVEVDSVPSLTVIVIVVVPLSFGDGVRVTVLFAPLPPKATFALGTSVVLLEVAVTVNVPMPLSGSPIVNAMALVGVFSGVD